MASKRIKITLELKRKIIEERENGVSVADLARIYNRSTSTICTILKNKDKIKQIDASKGVTRMSTQRLRILDDVERLLLIWINEKQLQGDTITEQIICEKAKQIFTDLRMKTPGSSTDKEEFKASRGWFEKFKKRTGIHSVMRHAEAECSYNKAAENYISDLKKLLVSEGYLSQQVFNCDETSLFWKKMPKRTYITEEEEALLDHKPTQELITQELVELQHISQQELVEENLLGKKEKILEKQQSSRAIREMLKAWEIVATHVENYHPNKAVVMRFINLFYVNAVSHFEEILEHRQKQRTLDKFIIEKD